MGCPTLLCIIPGIVMSVSTYELARARESANTLFEELQLDAFIYELEPRDEVWELTIECACEADGGWETVKLQMPKEMLLESFDDEMAREKLLAYCKKLLEDCKLRGPG
jgi:hypothetical protein